MRRRRPVRVMPCPPYNPYLERIRREERAKQDAAFAADERRRREEAAKLPPPTPEELAEFQRKWGPPPSGCSPDCPICRGSGRHE